jgi:hypothetical protein
MQVAEKYTWIACDAAYYNFGRGNVLVNEVINILEMLGCSQGQNLFEQHGHNIEPCRHREIRPKTRAGCSSIPRWT